MRNFLCGRCAHPEKVRTYCTGCRLLTDYSAGDLDELCASFNIQQVLEPGTVVVLACCALCPDGPKPQRIEIHSITA